MDWKARSLDLVLFFIIIVQLLPNVCKAECREENLPQIKNAYTEHEVAPLSPTGYKVRYVCLTGYLKWSGSPWAKCRKDGTWKTSNLECRPRRCPAPTSLENGSQSSYAYHAFSQIVYTCDAGFEFSGGTTEYSVLCLADGSWLGLPLPACQRIECPKPPYPADGVAFYNSRQYQAKAEYHCRHGYELVGQSTRRCTEDRTWSGEEPLCKVIVCPQPRTLFNGNVKVTSYVPRQGQAIYTCDKDYRLSGNNVKSCDQEGRWVGGHPSCQYCDWWCKLKEASTTAKDKIKDLFG